MRAEFATWIIEFLPVPPLPTTPGKTSSAGRPLGTVRCYFGLVPQPAALLTVQPGLVSFWPPLTTSSSSGSSSVTRPYASIDTSFVCTGRSWLWVSWSRMIVPLGSKLRRNDGRHVRLRGRRPDESLGPCGSRSVDGGSGWQHRVDPAAGSSGKRAVTFRTSAVSPNRET